MGCSNSPKNKNEWQQDLSPPPRGGDSCSAICPALTATVRADGTTKKQAERKSQTSRTSENMVFPAFEWLKNTRTRIDESVVVNLNKAADSQNEVSGQTVNVLVLI
jgi:hypothetical protein